MIEIKISMVLNISLDSHRQPYCYENGNAAGLDKTVSKMLTECNYYLGKFLNRLLIYRF